MSETARRFIGRESELQTLEALYSASGFQTVALYGRRDVGKTTLLRRFTADKPAVYFTAREPSRLVAQSDHNMANVAAFSKEIYAFFGMSLSAPAFRSWQDAFDFIAQKASDSRFIVVFDELHYAAAADSGFRSALQDGMGNRFLSTNLFLILCGSQIGWMEREVISNQGTFFGRKTARMKLAPFDYYDAAAFVPAYSPEEKIRLYSCIGGMPSYSEPD